MSRSMFALALVLASAAGLHFAPRFRPPFGCGEVVPPPPPVVL